MELISKEEAKDKVLRLERKLYRWSKKETYNLKRIHNLMYNPNVLSLSWHILRTKTGSRTPGIDGVTKKTVEEKIGVENWLTEIQEKLRNKTFKPDTVRRVYIEKEGKSEMRPLGIPTLEDRLVQTALKIILEPIFEAKFKGCSLGFRPSRGPLNAIAMVQKYMNPLFKYNWVIEADIRNCFGNIDHGILLQQMHKTIHDKRTLSLIRSFLKAGVMEDGETHYPISGSPQGGVISPLLANIYMDQLDEIYHQKYHTLSIYERRKRVKLEEPLFRLIRYADDFVIIVKGRSDQAEEELKHLRKFLKETLKMELAEEKSGVHSLNENFDFLGYTFRRGISKHTGRISTILLPSKEAVIRFRRKVKRLTDVSTTYQDIDEMLRRLNYLMRGWGEYFRYGWVNRLFGKLDHYIFIRIFRWLRKKHKRQAKKKHRRHNRKPRRGTIKWIVRRYLRPDITGIRTWRGKKHSFQRLNKICPARRIPWARNDETTPYNATEPGKQTTLWSFNRGYGLIIKMEFLLQRHKDWWRAG